MRGVGPEETHQRTRSSLHKKWDGMERRYSQGVEQGAELQDARALQARVVSDIESKEVNVIHSGKLQALLLANELF